MIEYLEELHEHDRATVDHTTLLLNCYAKLKDTGKLETFINSDNNFDFETAITMCRQGGYYDQAVYLAKKHGEHDLVADILIEDSKEYDNALDYVWRLGPDMAYPNLMKYARVLLEHCPTNTTQVFIDYYTGVYRPKKDLPTSAPSAIQGGMASAIPSFSSFIPLAYRASPNVASPATTDNHQAPLNEADAAEAEAAQPGPEYDVPKPRTAFSAFVDHPEEFIVFLESCLKQDYVSDGDKVDLYTALFEMYLETAGHKEGAAKDEWEIKAKRLIDSEHVSVGCGYLLYENLIFLSDSDRCFQCSLALTSFQLSGWDDFGTRAARSTF